MVKNRPAKRLSYHRFVRFIPKFMHSVTRLNVPAKNSEIFTVAAPSDKTPQEDEGGELLLPHFREVSQNNE